MCSRRCRRRRRRHTQRETESRREQCRLVWFGLYMPLCAPVLCIYAVRSRRYTSNFRVKCYVNFEFNTVSQWNMLLLAAHSLAHEFSFVRSFFPHTLSLFLPRVRELGGKKNAFDKLLRISIASSKSRGDLNSVEISCMFLRVMNTTARAPQVICFLLVIAEFLFSFASCFRGSSKNTHTRQKLRRTKTESRQFDRNTKQNK